MKAEDTKAEEKRFNETLKRMLKTPPKAHDKKPQPKEKAESKDGDVKAKPPSH